MLIILTDEITFPLVQKKLFSQGNGWVASGQQLLDFSPRNQYLYIEKNSMSYGGYVVKNSEFTLIDAYEFLFENSIFNKI